MAIFDETIEIRERCKGVYCVDLGESFPKSIYLQNLASIQPRTSLGPIEFTALARFRSGVARPWSEALALMSARKTTADLGISRHHQRAADFRSGPARH